MTIQDLTYYRNLIEIQTDIDPNLESVIAKLFPRLGDGLRWGLQNLRGLDARQRVLSDAPRFLELVEREDYASLGALGFAVPESMGSDYLTFTGAIVAGLDHATKMVETVLIPYEQTLAQIVSDELVRASVNPIIFKKIADYDRDRVKINALIQSCFNTSLRSRVPYEQAIKRNGDWAGVLENVRVMDRLTQADLKPVAKRVDDVLALLDKIIELAGNNDLKNTTKGLVRNLASATQAVAEEVSFLNTVYYHMETCKNGLETGFKDIIKALN